MSLIQGTLFISELLKIYTTNISDMFSGQFNSIISFLNYFKDEQTCLEYLEESRWKGDPICPHCKTKSIWHYSDKKTYRCKDCDKKFTVRTNSMFYKSHVSLRKWFIAIYLFINHKKGISSVQLARDIQVTQPTAWSVLHRIRINLKPSTPVKMDGVVELDETYVGGKNKNRHYSMRKKNSQGRSVTAKIPVFGIVERGGKVRSAVVPDVQRKTLSKEIYKTVRLRSSIMSDEWRAYGNLHKHFKHKMVFHGKYEYVRLDCHTNTIEGYWSILKRTIFGTYHWVSRKYIQNYCYAIDFRYNTRKDTQEIRFQKVISQSCERYIPIAKLVA